MTGEAPPDRRSAAEARGRRAEDHVAARLAAEGWTVLERRFRCSAGEIDLIAERDGLLAFIEVKHRARLDAAAQSFSAPQQARVMGAAEAWIAANPGHGGAGMRFDLLLVDGAGRMRRIADALRLG